MKTVLALACVALLAACAPNHPLSECKGHLFQLNAGEWQATPADLTAQKDPHH